MFKYTESLSVAMTVLELTHNNLVDLDIANDSWVECMDNGREQGLVLCYFGKGKNIRFMVCQERNSDRIVIYEKTEHSLSNTPTAEEYKDKTTFMYNQPYEAADYIARRMEAKCSTKQ